MLNKMCASITSGFIRDLNVKYGVARAVISLASYKTKSIAKSIRDSFDRAKKITNRSPQKHHLAAKGASNAALAANILRKVLPMGAEDPANFIYIKAGLHARIHTNAYYGYANSVVISAYNSANGDKQKQETNVYIALGALWTFVNGLNIVSPY